MSEFKFSGLPLTQNQNFYSNENFVPCIQKNLQRKNCYISDMIISQNFANLTSCEKMTIFRNYAVTSGLCYIMTFPPHKKKPVHDPGVSMRPTLTY